MSSVYRVKHNIKEVVKKRFSVLSFQNDVKVQFIITKQTIIIENNNGAIDDIKRQRKKIKKELAFSR